MHTLCTCICDPGVLLLCLHNIRRLDDDEYFVDKLTPDHTELVGSYYKRINEDYS